MRRGGQRRPAAFAGMMAAAVLLGALGGAPAGWALPVAPAAVPAVQEDIRDIRVPRTQAPLWLWIAPAAGGILILLIGYRAWRRRRVRPIAATPYEVALRRLEAARGLMQPAQSDEFSVAVSGILRTYVEQAFHVTATHRTTEEFLRDLVQSSNAALVPHRNGLADFLRQCDLVKFAGTSLSPEGMESLHGSALAFVQETGRESHVAVPSA